MGEITLIGTAHVSEKSIKEVEEAIESIKPDIVAVELCPARYATLKGEEMGEISIKDILKSGRVYLFFIQWLLAYVQKKIGADLGVEPGAEMMAAIRKAEEIGSDVYLVDREIQITLQRFWNKMKFFEKLKMLFSLISAIAGRGEEIDIEKITEDDIVSQLIKELREFSPGAASALIDERDAYIAKRLLQIPEGKRVVAVVGAGHKEGIQRYLKNPEKIPPIDEISSTKKRRFSIGKLIGAIFFFFLLFFFGLIILSGVPPAIIMKAFFYWIIINGVLSGVGVLIARGHPLSILTAFSIAWLTSLNPFLAAGWFAGIVEAWIRNPTVKEIREIFDVETFEDLIRNKFFRVLLVCALANIGSIIGTFIGAYVVWETTGMNLENVFTMFFHA
ncbi:MAG: TraB/GumN family protein [Candidatus Syntropharchaeia archaeon]